MAKVGSFYGSTGGSRHPATDRRSVADRSRKDWRVRGEVEGVGVPEILVGAGRDGLVPFLMRSANEA